MRVHTAGIEWVAVLALASCTSFAGLQLPADGGAQGGDAGQSGSWSAYGDLVQADAPIAFWRFEEALGPVAKDSSGRGHECSYFKDAALGSAGALAGSHAVKLPGVADGFLQCGDAPFDLAGTAAMSLEAWIFTEVLDDVYRRVVSKEERDAQGRRRGYNINVSQPRRIRFERFEAGQEICAAELTIELNVWSHVVATFEGGVARLFVDGRVASDTCDAIGLVDHAAPFTIGAQSDQHYGYFRGSIDEVAVYDKALSPERVAAHEL